MDTEAIEKSCKFLNQLFVHTIENMKSGFSIWKDFTYKGAKLHMALRSICQAVSGFLEAFQKMADLATNAKGSTKEIGVALTRLCLRHRNIEKKLDHVTHTFERSLINPIEEKLEDWKKLVLQIEKEHARDSKKASREYKKVSLQAEKIEKKNKKDANLLRELTILNMEKNEKLIAMETVEKSSVRSALIEERRRHCHIVLAMKPFVDAEMALLSDLMHLEEIMSNLTRQSQEPNILPSCSEQVILDITSQTIPEGWSCQSTRNFPTPSDSLLSLSSLYSASNRSSIVSEFDAQSAIADINLNASLSSLPVSLLRNHRAGGSVPPPLDRGSRNGRQLYRQSLYNPALAAESQSSSSTGITYLHQQHQSQRQKQMDGNSRLIFPSTSAPTTPEVKLQPNPLISQAQQKVVGKPPTFPPSYLRRKGSFGRAIHPTQPSSSFSPSPTSGGLPSFQSSWTDSDRPRSLALGNSGQNQFSHSFSEQTVCSLAPPASQNPSLSSSSTLKDDEEREGENQDTLRLAKDCLHKISNAVENVQERPVTSSDQSPSKSSPQNQTVATYHSVPANVSSPTKNNNISRDSTENVNNGFQKRVTSPESRGCGGQRNEYASPHVMGRSIPANQRAPFAVPPQQIIDGYKIRADNASKSTPSPKSVNYVDFHTLSGNYGSFNQPGNNNSTAKVPTATNQVFINLEKNLISQSNVNPSQVQSSQFVVVSPHQVQSSVKYSGMRPDCYNQFHHQQHLAQLENESPAYGIFMGRPVHSAPYNQHFQEKIIAYNPHQENQNRFVNHSHQSPMAKCSPVRQHHYPQGQPYKGYVSPSVKRQLPPPPCPSFPANIDNSLDRRLDGQFCPWTLRAGSPDRSTSTTPTNETNSTPLPLPPNDEALDPNATVVCASSYVPLSSHDETTQQKLPRGFVKHWENSV